MDKQCVRVSRYARTGVPPLEQGSATRVRLGIWALSLPGAAGPWFLAKIHLVPKFKKLLRFLVTLNLVIHIICDMNRFSLVSPWLNSNCQSMIE